MAAETMLKTGVYVYFLVEPDHFKIGHSKTLASRARTVTPDLIREASFAILFPTKREAISCEKAIQFYFRKWNLPQMPRDGGTEFFKLDCLAKVEQFVRDGKEHLGFEQIQRINDLMPLRVFTPAASIDREERRRMRAEKHAEKQERLHMSNIRNGEVLLKMLTKLRDENCLRGYTSIETPYGEDKTVLVVILENDDQREQLSTLAACSNFFSDSGSCSLIGGHIGSGFGDDIESLAKVFGVSEDGLIAVVDVSIDTIEQKELRKVQEEMLEAFRPAADLLRSLPTLDEVERKVVRTIFPKNWDFWRHGHAIVETNADLGEAKLLFVAQEDEDDGLPTDEVCMTEWEKKFRHETLGNNMRYVLAKATARGYHMVAELLR